MIRNPTVFVIGAGAGADIEMCVGETLMHKIAADVNIRFEGGTKQVSGDYWITETLRSLARNQSKDGNEFYGAGRNIATGVGYAGSIDNYIHNHRKNEAIKTVGKIAIVKNIIAYEKQSSVFIDSNKHPPRFRNVAGVVESWLHSFIRLIGDGLVVGENLDNIFANIAVVTFNYDRCLEHFLWKALQERFGIGTENAKDLVDRLEVLHAYGRVAPLDWQEKGGLHFGGDPHNNKPDLAALSANIRTYNEEVEDKVLIDKIHDRMLWAERVVFLGFHFHQQNVELITPVHGIERKQVKHAYATVVKREEPERALIRDQISRMLVPSAREVEVHLSGVKCREFFGIWGTTLES
jgi:hypothetical protein